MSELYPRRCEATKPDGSACKATPLRDQPFCFFHSPETKRAHLLAVQKGGLMRRWQGEMTTGQMATYAEIRGILAQIAHDLVRGEIPPPHASVLVAVCRGAMESIKAEFDLVGNGSDGPLVILDKATDALEEKPATPEAQSVREELAGA